MPADSTVHCVADVHAVLGEGPVWVAREARALLARHQGPQDLPARWRRRAQPMADAVAGRVDRAAQERRVHRRHRPGDRRDRPRQRTASRSVAQPRSRLPRQPLQRRQGRPPGRFWAGTMDDQERQASGTLYRVDADLSWAAVDQRLPGHQRARVQPVGDLMYHNDSARQVTYAFDLDADGTAANRRIFLQFGEGDGYPDGMTVDAEGCLWIAFWDGWCVRRYLAAGELAGDDRRCPSRGRPAARSAGPTSIGSTSPRRASASMKRIKHATKCRGVVYGHSGGAGALPTSPLRADEHAPTTDGD